EARVGGQLIAAHAVAKKMSIRPPEYKPPPRRAYTNLGWIFAALTGPATLLAVWIYCAVTYGFLLGFFLCWIPALILASLHCRGDDLFMAAGSGSGSICDLPSFRRSSRVIDLHRRIRRHHRNRNDLVVACSEQQVLKWTIEADDPIDQQCAFKS